MTIAFIIYRIYKTIFYNTVSIVKSQMYLYSRHITKNSIINIQIKEKLFAFFKEYFTTYDMESLL